MKGNVIPSLTGNLDKDPRFREDDGKIVIPDDLSLEALAKWEIGNPEIQIKFLV